MAALATVNDPELHKDIVSLGFIRDLTIEGADVSFRVMLTNPACPLKDAIRRDCEEALRRDAPEIGDVRLEFSTRVGILDADIYGPNIPSMLAGCG